MKVTLHGNVIDVEVEDHFNVQDDNLDYEMCRQGKLLAYYAQMAAALEAQAKNRKLDLDRLSSKADLDIRTEGIDKGKKLTEAQVKAMITVREDFKQATQAYIEAQKDADTMSNLWKSIYLKSGLLRSMKNRQDAEAFNNDS